MSSSQTSSAKAPIVVLGAGVIGLTTAVRILESPLCTQDGHPVHILAVHLPDDPLDAYYASTIAGAHHLSFADDADLRQRKWDRRTFEIMAAECTAEGEHATGIMMLKQTETYVGAKTHLAIYEEHPDFRILDDIPGCDHSISFTSLTMNPPVYLRRLLKRIQSNPLARIHRLHLPSLAAVHSGPVKALIGPDPPLALIVCVGIGALTLGGVEDTTVFPTRGQVVKLRAPWVRSGWTRQVGSLQGGEGGERTYVIPRQSGEVIVGGTRENDDWYPYPRPETTTDILRRALEICPEIVPANMISASSAAGQGFPEELIEQNLVGFRPSRKDGVRLEKGADVGSTAVVYNYGHGGAGWQSCWGTAEDAVSLLLNDTVARRLGNTKL